MFGNINNEGVPCVIQFAMTGLCSLLYGLTHSLIRKVQSVQNAAARLLTGRRGDHISPVLRQLHWLPIQSLPYLFIIPQNSF